MALDMVTKRVYDYKERICIENRNLSLSTLREKWFGEDRNKRTLFGALRLSILDLEKLVAKRIYKKSTLTKYKSTERHLIEFMEWKNNGCDVLKMPERMILSAKKPTVLKHSIDKWRQLCRLLNALFL
jgi:hypothetical protein